MAPKSSTPMAVMTEAAAKAILMAKLEVFDKLKEIVVELLGDESGVEDAFQAVRDEIEASCKVKTKKTRGPTMYHKFLSAKMLELKETEPDLDSKGRLVRAQQLYKEHKEELSNSNSTDVEVEEESDESKPVEKPKKSKASKAKKSSSSDVEDDEEPAAKPKKSKGKKTSTPSSDVEDVEEASETEEPEPEEPKKSKKSKKSKN